MTTETTFPLCDVCGEPITDMDNDHFTDDEVCQGSDGPGFFLHEKCWPHGKTIEERRAIYEAGRAKSEANAPIETIELRIMLPVKRVADLIQSGLYSGLAWWVKSVGIDGDIFEDGTIVLTTRENGDKTLDLDAIGNAMFLFYEKEPRHFADWIAGRDDATTGDVFIQLCVFGEVVYG